MTKKTYQITRKVRSFFSKTLGITKPLPFMLLVVGVSGVVVTVSVIISTRIQPDTEIKTPVSDLAQETSDTIVETPVLEVDESQSKSGQNDNTATGNPTNSNKAPSTQSNSHGNKSTQNNESLPQNNTDSSSDNPASVNPPPVDKWATAPSCGTNCKYLMADGIITHLQGSYKGEVPLPVYNWTNLATAYRRANPDKTTIKIVCGDYYVLSMIYSEFMVTPIVPSKQVYWCNKSGHNGYNKIEGVYDINGIRLSGLGA